MVTDAVVTTDVSGRIRDFNPAAEVLTGWTHAEAEGLPVELLFELRENISDARLLNPVYKAIVDNAPVKCPGQPLLVAKGGRRMAVKMSAAPLTDAAGDLAGAALFLRDVSESVQLAERLAYLAQYDSLTGLPNRILLVDRMEQATKVADRHNNQIAVLSVDLNTIQLAKVTHSFQEIRAVAGPALADRLLKDIASRLSFALRESDTVSRLGNCDFVLLLPGITTVEDVDSVAAKLVEALSRPYPVEGHTFTAECSIGVSLYPRDASDAATLMRLADAAMIQAKQVGPNQYRFAGHHEQPLHFIHAVAPSMPHHQRR